VVLRYDTIEIELAGASRTDGLYSAERLLPGSSQTEYASPSENITVSPGEVDLTISLLLGSDVVASTTTTVTAE